MKLRLLIIITLILLSCSEDNSYHEKFMSSSDCFVYKREVISESFNKYTVEYIDTSKASGCVKSQLNDVYLLTISSDYFITVAPNHPANNIYVIESFMKRFNNDSIRLSNFYKERNRVYLTLSRRYQNIQDSSFNNRFMEWKHVFCSKKGKYWKIDSTRLTTLLPWGNIKED